MKNNLNGKQEAIGGIGNPKPFLLDLFCGAGGASMGYYKAGFQVMGVDKNKQPEYPFNFVQCDAIDYLRFEWRKVDVIAASPQFQHFTKYKNCRTDLKDTY